MASIPGITAKHAIITPECRVNRGQEGAFDEAVRRLKAEYLAHHAGAWGNANCHLALTIERPDLPQVGESPVQTQLRALKTQQLVHKSFEAGYDVGKTSAQEEVNDEISYITKAIEALPRYTIRDVEQRPDSDEYIHADELDSLADRLSALTAPQE